MRFLSPKDIARSQDKISKYNGPGPKVPFKLYPGLVGCTVFLNLPTTHVLYNRKAVILEQREADGAFKVLVSGTTVTAYLKAADIHLDSATNFLEV